MNRRLAFWLALALLMGAASCSDSPTEKDELDETAPALSVEPIPDYACMPYAIAGDVVDRESGVASVALLLDGEEIDRADYACPGAPDSAHFALTVSEPQRSAPVEVKLLATDCEGNQDSLIFEEVTFLDSEAVPEILDWSLDFHETDDGLTLSLAAVVQHEFSWLDFSLRLDGEEVYAFEGLPGSHTHTDACTVPWGWSEATLTVTSHCGVATVSGPIAPPACHGTPRIISPEEGTVFCEPQPVLLIAAEVDFPCDDSVDPESVTLFHEGLAFGTDEDGSDGWRFYFELDYAEPMETCFMARAVFADQAYRDSEPLCIQLDLPRLELLLVGMDAASQTVTLRAEPHCLPTPIWCGWSTPGISSTAPRATGIWRS